MKLNRKEFIHLGAKSILLSSIIKPVKLFSKNQEKVAIIGAGAAGLYAATLLHKEGIQVEIFEASNIPGGRARPLLKFADFPVELGAEEVHGENSSYYEYIDKKGITLINKDFENYYMIKGELLEESQAELDEKYAKTQKAMQALVNYKGSDINAEEYFIKKGVPESYFHIPEALVGNEYGTNLKRLSTLGISNSLNQWSAGENDYLIRNRSHLSILEEMSATIMKFVRTNTRIVNVDYSKDLIQLTDQKGNKYSATRVIVAVPITILRDGDIQFSPGLPGEKVSSFKKIGMGGGMKVILKFIKRFWESNTGSIVSDGIIPEYWSSGNRKSSLNNVLTGFINGENAEKISKNGNDIVKMAVQDLDRIFGKKFASKWLSDSYVMDWSKEPYIKGTYSYPIIGEGNAREDLAKPVKNKLFFAGEATNLKGHFATVHGAIETAERVVSEILEIV